MSALNLFIPITKVDAAQRLVYGVATAECEDKAGEICDYASTKPNYQKWSRAIAQATDGKSLGNLRAMHGRTAAGKITSLSFDNSAKKIEICAKVVDDAEWDKVCEGVYTGFSQGGAYVDRWRDDAGLMRYTADPSEISLVDLPCLSHSTFQMIKSDGATQVLSFKDAAGEDGEQVWRSRRDGKTFMTKSDLLKHHAQLDGLAKIGARNSKEDQAHIQAAHDSMVAAGARCRDAQDVHGAKISAPHDAGGAEEAAKLAGDGVELTKAIGGIQSVLDEVLHRLSAMERQPASRPASGAAPALSKGDQLLALTSSNPDAVGKFIEANRDALALEAIKAAQRQPLLMLPRI